MTNNKTQPTTDTVQANEARAARIEQRQEIITALAHPFWKPFRLIKLGLDSKERVIINLDFTATHFPGSYTSDIVRMLLDLEELGLVTTSKDRAGQVSYMVDIEDETAKALIDELLR